MMADTKSTTVSNCSYGSLLKTSPKKEDVGDGRDRGDRGTSSDADGAQRDIAEGVNDNDRKCCFSVLVSFPLVLSLILVGAISISSPFRLPMLSSKMRYSPHFAFFAVAAAAIAGVGAEAEAETAAEPPSVVLRNAADEGVVMPWIGLGTGGYGADPAVGYGGYPECNADDYGCGAYVKRAISDWIDAGGRRLDCSDSYRNQRVVGEAIDNMSDVVRREDLFIVSKVGPSLPLGYRDALDQFETMQRDLRTDYVDLLLIHWPEQDTNVDLDPDDEAISKDPACRRPRYNATTCRLNTWRALVDIWRGGGARAIGVSNYYRTHLEEIVRSGLPLPALTQNPFHLYRSSSQMSTVDYCRRLGIAFNGYSPLGVPDWHTFPSSSPGGTTTGMSPKQLDDPAVVAVARELRGATPAQALLAWQWRMGIPVNPRSQNREHMEENLAAWRFAGGLTPDQMETLSSRPQDWCSVDPGMYECAPDDEETLDVM